MAQIQKLIEINGNRVKVTLIAEVSTDAEKSELQQACAETQHYLAVSKREAKPAKADSSVNESWLSRMWHQHGC